MESSPGGSQGETQSSTSNVMRAMAANPLCKVETHLLILDEDAIRNSEHCDCVQKKDHECDKPDDKDDAKGNDKRGGGSGGNGGSGSSSSGAARTEKITVNKDPRDCDKDDKGGKDDKSANCDKSGKDPRNCDKNGKDDDKDCKRETQVTICHIPPGNHDNGHTITVGESAVKAHMAHGDKLGACPETVPPPCSGAAAKGGVGGDSHGGRYGDFENGFCETSAIGKRTTVKYFAENIGREILLPSGSVGDEGWFAPTSVRIAWKNAGPEIGDGLRNYLDAGPGLGSPDAKGNRESLLDNVPDLTPLRAMGLARLEGSAICGIVLDGEVKMSYSPIRTGNIQGPNLGKVAFQVLGTENASGRSATDLPYVRVRILDAEAVCADPLTLVVNVDRPSCSVLQTLVSEPWNTFDSALWRGDGGQLVANGFFMAQEGGFSAAADYISPCPVPVESTCSSKQSSPSSPTRRHFARSAVLLRTSASPSQSFWDA